MWLFEVLLSKLYNIKECDKVERRGRRKKVATVLCMFFVLVSGVFYTKCASDNLWIIVIVSDFEMITSRRRQRCARVSVSGSSVCACVRVTKCPIQ